MARHFGHHEQQTGIEWSEWLMTVLAMFIVSATVVMLVGAVFLVSMVTAWPRDLDGKYADNPLHQWFDGLMSGKGLCCSFADGRTVDDPDVDMDGPHYKVRVDGQWLTVPDDALVTVPNKFGRAVVWPYFSTEDNQTHIRCFMPGSGS